MPSAAKFASMYEAHIRRHKPEMVREFENAKELRSHVDEVGQQAMDRFETIVANLVTAPSPPNESGPDRVARFEAIPLIAYEIVEREIIFIP